MLLWFAKAFLTFYWGKRDTNLFNNLMKIVEHLPRKTHIQRNIENFAYNNSGLRGTLFHLHSLDLHCMAQVYTGQYCPALETTVLCPVSVPFHSKIISHLDDKLCGNLNQGLTWPVTLHNLLGMQGPTWGPLSLHHASHCHSAFAWDGPLTSDAPLIH